MKTGKKLRQSLDSNDTFMGGGHQIVKPRTYKSHVRRQTPSWVFKDSEVQKVLLRSFPKLKTNAKQRDAAARWAAVINLFFRLGYTDTQVAQELGTSPLKIECVVRSIRRASQGLRTDGRGLLGARKRGRPKKHAV